MKKFPFWQSLIENSRWLTLGLGIKRWFLLLGVGSLVAGMGFVYVVLLMQRQDWLPTAVYDFITLQFLPPLARALIPLILGGGLMFTAVYKIGKNLVAPFKNADERIVTSLYDYSRRARGPHIVALGGGTGMPALIRGLTAYTRNITAIVTVADDGGSSGRLRRELGLLPPGDFRNNLAALSRDEALMTQVLQYRFGGVISESGQSDLQGHAFGNLLLAALTGITGSFDEALLAAERVLGLRGRVLPSTLAHVNLEADIQDDDGNVQHVVGESAIPKAHGAIQQIYLEPATARAYPPALKAILQAELIVIGPGSLYTSILPNLLVQDLAEALYRSKAQKLYICNLATQPGETDNYSVADHVATLLQHIPTNFLDIVLANDNLSVPSSMGGGQTVFVQPAAPEGVQMVAMDLVDEKRPWRHDSAKLAKAVMGLVP